MTKNLLNTLLAGLLTLAACQPKKTNINVEPLVLHETMQQLTDIIVHDIFRHQLPVGFIFIQVLQLMRSWCTQTPLMSLWLVS